MRGDKGGAERSDGGGMARFQRQRGREGTLKMVSLIMSEWMAATPFTALLPTTARYAMLITLQSSRQFSYPIKGISLITHTFFNLIFPL